MKLDNKNGNNMKTLKSIENGAMYELPWSIYASPCGAPSAPSIADVLGTIPMLMQNSVVVVLGMCPYTPDFSDDNDMYRVRLLTSCGEVVETFVNIFAMQSWRRINVKGKA
jgi:hypothetical protein